MTDGTSPLTAPAAWYVDPTLWPTERQEIFAKTWQFVTHVSDFPEPGCWRAETLADFPVLLVKDDGGAIRAFHNVCRHRAGPLTDGASGRCDRELTCRYHGWRYAFDGRLRVARDFGLARDFDVRDFSLLPLRVGIWRGLVFVAIGGDPPPLDELLAPLDARLGPADWSDHRVALRRSHELRCNWKTYVENYLEGYHVPVLHPGLDAEIRSSDYKVRVEGAIALHEVPLRRPDPVYGGLWAWGWPNIGFNIYARGLMIERMSPLKSERTRLDYVYLTPDGEAVPPTTLAMSDAVAAEDAWITERVQENLAAGVYERGRLSPRHEGAVGRFQAMLAHAIGRAL